MRVSRGGAISRVPDEVNEKSKGARSAFQRLKHAVLNNNHSLLVQLMDAIPSPDAMNARDVDGWNLAHHAAYGLHLSMLQLLLRSGRMKESSLLQPDHKGRIPLDLMLFEEKAQDTAASDTTTGWALFSVGSGANFCLGTAAESHSIPTRVDAIHSLSSSRITELLVSKFHSCALSEDGELFTWGWGGGKGPRLGHPDMTNNMAQILPRQVLNLPRVTSIAAGKHHMLACAETGEVWSWGSNEKGQLGYSGPQEPAPRIVASLKGKTVRSVSASNVHSLALTENGEVLSWGSNSHGQLGYTLSGIKGNPTADFKQLSSDHNPAFLYGVSPKNIRGADSSFSHVPRLVDALKGKRVTSVSCSKRHTGVVTDKGEVFTWGFRSYIPKKVSLAPPPSSIQYHKGHNEVTRPSALLLAAGFSHTSVITQGGRVLSWSSSDPLFKVSPINLPGGRSARSISAGKHSTTIVTTNGEVFAFESNTLTSSQDPATSSPFVRNSSASSSSSLSLGIPLKSPSLHSTFLSSASPPQPSSLVGAKPILLGSSPPNPTTSVSPPSAKAFTQPILQRVEGIRRVDQVARGEKHAIFVVGYRVPNLFGPSTTANSNDIVPQGKSKKVPGAARSTFYSDEDDELQLDDESEKEEEEEEEEEGGVKSSNLQTVGSPLSQLGWEGDFESVHPDVLSPIPSLQTLCQMSVANHLVEVRSACQVLEYADASGALYLRDYCIAYILSNLDCLLLDSLSAFVRLPCHLVELLESRLKSWMVGGAQETPNTNMATSATTLDPRLKPQPFNRDSHRPTLFTPPPAPEDPIPDSLPKASPSLSPRVISPSADYPSTSSSTSARNEVETQALVAVHSLPMSPVSKAHSSHPRPFDHEPNQSPPVLSLNQFTNPISPISEPSTSRKEPSVGPGLISAAAGGGKKGSKKIALDVFLNGGGPSTSAPAPKASSSVAINSPPPLAAWNKSNSGEPAPVTSPLMVLEGESRTSSSSLNSSLPKTGSKDLKSSSKQTKEAGNGAFTLGDFMKTQSKPKASSPASTSRAAWANSSPSPSSSAALIGSSPPSQSPMSLKAIQEELERRKMQTLGASPPLRSSSLLMGSSPPTNKWYVSEDNQSRPSQNVQLIQEEEAAMNELRKLFPGAQVRVKKS